MCRVSTSSAQPSRAPAYFLGATPEEIPADQLHSLLSFTGCDFSHSFRNLPCDGLERGHALRYFPCHISSLGGAEGVVKREVAVRLTSVFRSRKQRSQRFVSPKGRRPVHEIRSCRCWFKSSGKADIFDDPLVFCLATLHHQINTCPRASGVRQSICNAPASMRLLRADTPTREQISRIRHRTEVSG